MTLPRRHRVDLPRRHEVRYRDAVRTVRFGAELTDGAVYLGDEKVEGEPLLELERREVVRRVYAHLNGVRGLGLTFFRPDGSVLTEADDVRPETRRPWYRWRSAWCCELFEDLAREAGREGLSVIVADIGDQPAFLLQSRAVDHGAEVHARDGRRLVLATQQAIFYCPFCAVRLDRFYRYRLSELKRPDLSLSYYDAEPPVT